MSADVHSHGKDRVSHGGCYCHFNGNDDANDDVFGDTDADESNGDAHCFPDRHIHWADGRTDGISRAHRDAKGLPRGIL